MYATQEMSETRVPLVSIAIPVFNGEAYLGEAIQSVLDQTLSDFELIICDNCSTDRTQAICEAYLASDPRIRYVRHPRNLGAGPNYDYCFHLARGTYFKWAAHDDMLAPRFLELAVKAFEARPEAVLCTVGIREIGPIGETYREFSNVFEQADAQTPAARLGALIHTTHQCEDFFGLYRREALVGSGLHDTYTGSDRVLLAEMALRGPWVSTPEPLFLHREHDMRYTRAVLLIDSKQAALWQDTSGPTKQRNTMFHLGIYRRYWRLVNKTVPSASQRMACYVELLRWWSTDGHCGDVVRDVLRTISPTLFSKLRLLKQTSWGPNHKLRPGSLPSLSGYQAGQSGNEVPR